MFVCGLLEKVSRRLAGRKALQPYAVSERLDQLGEVLIAKRGDQLNVEFEIGIKEGNQIAGIRCLPRGLRQLTKLVELSARQSALGDIANARTKRQGEGKLPQWPITGKVKPDPRTGEMDCPAPLTMVQAAKCLEEIYQDKFFALVDTWDPHEPWDPPAYYVRHYLPDYNGERVHPPYGDCKKHGMTDRDIAVARALYSGELELVDRWIGHLLDQLAYLGIEDSTAIIFVSDHGFLLGEHGLMGKMVRRAPGEATWMRSPLYEEIAKVPLLIHVPGAKPGRTSKLACALDLAPTICDMAGLPRQAEMQGLSLLPAVNNQAFEGRDHVLTALPLANPGDTVEVVDDLMRTVVEWQPVTITTQRWSLLYATPSEPVELYDLSSDPKQTTNVAAKHPAVIRSLLEMYADDLRRAGVTKKYSDPRLAGLLEPAS